MLFFTVNKILRNICKEEDKEKRIEKVDKLKQNNNIITDEKIIRTYFLKKDIITNEILIYIIVFTFIW